MNNNTINNDRTMGGGATGTLLAGRYRVVRPLGQGGMGSVWLAEDMKLDGFKVAIKMLPSVLVNNKRAYAQVKAMDYIDGQTLDDALAEKGKLSSGTLLYMSPEQLNGEAPKPAQDVYSFAAMAYECLAGHPPFSRGQIEYQIINHKPEPLPGNSAIFHGVMAGLEKTPEARPATCAAVLSVGSRVPRDRMDDGVSVGRTQVGSPNDSEYERIQEEIKKYKGILAQKEAEKKKEKSLFGLIKWEVTTNPSRHKGDDLPAGGISWDDCQGFAKKINATAGVSVALPTEAQWEYACRAGSTTPFNFGTSLNGDKANCNGNYPCGTATRGLYRGVEMPVGSYAPNAWGLYDMHGNVFEWCLDRYGTYPLDDVTDPLGPESALTRVFRGGSWCNTAQQCRSAARYSGDSGYRNDILGFRLVCSEEPHK